MKKPMQRSSFTTSALCAALLAFSSASGCQGKAQTSSSTNWLTCRTDADCAVVAGATCRDDFVCIDASGRPIAAAMGTGGAQSVTGGVGSNPGATGGIASVSGGRGNTAGSGAGGAVSGAGGAPMSDAGAAGASVGGADAGAGGSAASSGGVNAAGAGGDNECPAGPPALNSACNAPGLVCEYAGSSVGVIATCDAGSWILEQSGGDPAYVCPTLRPDEGSACPAPPTPSTSALVCLFDCAGNLCQGNQADCRATQADCVEDAQTRKHSWQYRQSSGVCATCDDTQTNAAAWTAPALDKSCQSSSDCFVARHYFNCCGSVRYVGYNLSERASFDAYEQTCQARVACDCMSVVEAENGTALNKGAATAACVDGVCRAVCTAEGCHFTSDCSASDECLTGTTCTWINPLSGANICRQTDGTCGGC